MTRPTERSTSGMADTKQHADLESYVDAFESAFANGEIADVANFLPPVGHTEYHQTVTELLRVDLEHRKNRGEEISIAPYLQRFPDSLSHPARLQELAYEEYRLRCVAGETPSADRFSQRYDIDTNGWPAPSELVDNSSRSAEARTITCFLEPGQTFLDFRILAEFGRGAFSRVYLAQQGNLANRFVVLKASSQLRDESEILARLQHTHIMPIHSVHSSGDLQIVCMPFWGTCTLADVLSELGDRLSHRSGQTLLNTIANHQNETVVSWLHEGVPETRDSATNLQPVTAVATASPDEPLTQEERLGRSYVDACLAMAADLADGLAHAHDRGIIHSDLKPANVLLGDDGRPLILDFNLARSLDRPAEAGVGGTLPYMAPEHLRQMSQPTLGPSTFASDIFSLGVILFELLSGKKPFPTRSGSFEEIVDQLVQDREAIKPSLCEAGADVPRSVDSIVQRCLAPRLEDRYRTAEQLRVDLLAQLQQEPLVYAREGLAQRMAKSLRRNPKRVWISVALVSCVVAVFGLLGYAQQSKRNAVLIAEETYQNFDRDMEWMTSVLTAPVVADRQLSSVFERAEGWLSTYSTVPALPAGKDLPTRLANQLGELTLALADARLEQAAGIDEESRRLELFDQAMHWNERSSQYFAVEMPAAAAQRRTIQFARNADQTAPADWHSDEPSTSLGYELLGRQQFRNGQLDDALRTLEQASSLSPKDYSIWAQRGYVHRARHEYGEAEKCFSICVVLRHDLAFSYFQRGLARLEGEEYQSAFNDFDHYLSLEVNDPNGLINRALAQKGIGRPRLALRDLESAVRLGSQEPRLFLVRSELCLAIGDKEGAANYLREGLERLPRDERNWLSRGMARLRANDPHNALVDFQAALRANPNSINARMNIAHVLSDHLDRVADAVDVMTEAVDLKPRDAELLASRAVLSAREGQTTEARSDIAAALAIQQDVTTLIRAGCVYALTQQGDDDVRNAVDYIRKAMARNPSWAGVIATDPDLVSVRNDDQFRDIIKAAKKLLK